MKWIKYSERKPHDIELVILRRISNRLFIITEIYEYDGEVLSTGKETILWSDVEWLDETGLMDSAAYVKELENKISELKREIAAYDLSFENHKKQINDLKEILLMTYPIVSAYYRNKGEFLVNPLLDKMEREIESIRPKEVQAKTKGK